MMAPTINKEAYINNILLAQYLSTKFAAIGQKIKIWRIVINIIMIPALVDHHNLLYNIGKSVYIIIVLHIANEYPLLMMIILRNLENIVWKLLI